MKQFHVLYPTIQRAIIVRCNVNTPSETNPLAKGEGVSCLALIDTGAMCTCISKRLAEHLRLVPSGTKDITGANNHTDTVDTYIVHVSLGDIEFPLHVCPCLEMTSHDMIIGMDILNHGELVISNKTGKTIFLFQVEN